jgi:phosphate transport system permease protein
VQTTPQRRQRQTSDRVYFFDRLSHAVITVGGVGVLAAVLGLCVYLTWVVVPLFTGADVSQVVDRNAIAHESRQNQAQPLAVTFDEGGHVKLELTREGSVRISEIRSNALFGNNALFHTSRPTSASAIQNDGLIAVGFEDGSIRIGTLAFSESLLKQNEISQEDSLLPINGSKAVPDRKGLMVRISPENFRLIIPSVEFGDPLPLRSGTGAVVAIDFKISTTGKRLVVVRRADGTTLHASVEAARGLSAKQAKTSLVETMISGPAPLPASQGWLFITSDGSSVLDLTESGTLTRYAVSETTPKAVRLADTHEVFAAPSTDRVTTAAMLQGGLTIVVGDSAGRVRSFMVGQDPTANTPDQQRLVQSDEFDVPGKDRAPNSITALGMSVRDREIAVGTAGGTIRVRHMTSRKVVASMSMGDDPGAISQIALLPKGDAVYASTQQGNVRLWKLEGGHPEASVSALFTPRLYEGRITPAFTYQAAGGNEASESKTSLIPLIFGTLKATIVAMFFAVPIAVLAAIYTSEFLEPRTRKVVKPAIEMMASLPSVVLGFIAAMIVAPLIADRLGMVLGTIFIVPLAILVGAHAWQVLPPRTVMLAGRRWRVAMITACIAAGLALSAIVGTIAERRMFKPTLADRMVAAGQVDEVPRSDWPAWVGQRTSMSADDQKSLRRSGLYFVDGRLVRPTANAPTPPADAAGPPSIIRWLNGSIGDAHPGWVLLLSLPAITGFWVFTGRFSARLSDASSARSRQARSSTNALVEFIRLLACIVGGLTTAYIGAEIFTAAGWDTRDSLLGPFSQRNALVVGIIMGFAIIPIIFTISEDALRSVPATLRSASLAVGATPWQTAVRVVLPAAASGVFSACMIGLGRAVGETMIVLMATGNTPDMSPNIFSGFRTLAANIAVELPESEKGGTHYRVLFLCGLTLFAMTFVINTTAEIVRQRFRKRTAAM